MAEGRQMTRSEYTKREAELEYLKSVRRPEVQERIKKPVLTGIFPKMRNTMRLRTKRRNWMKKSVVWRNS